MVRMWIPSAVSSFCFLPRQFILLFLAKHPFLNKHDSVVQESHHSGTQGTQLGHQVQTLLQGQGRRQATQGTNHKDGSGHGFCCFSDPNAQLCHLSVRQRPLLLAQVSANFPTHSIWNVLLVLIVLPKPLPIQLLFTHTWIFLKQCYHDSSC